MNQPDFIVENKTLKDLNWWRVGGDAQYFAAPKTIDELKLAWRWAWQKKLKIWVISGGSNVLIQDGVILGLVISMHDLKGIEKVETGEKVLITCFAGTPKSEVAKIFIQN